MHEPRLTPDEHAIESQLAQLAPAAPTRGSAELMYEFGRRIERRRTRRWQAGASLLALAFAAALTLSLMDTPEPERVVIVERPAQDTQEDAGPAEDEPREPALTERGRGRLPSPRTPRTEHPYSLAALQRTAISEGVDALPAGTLYLPPDPTGFPELHNMENGS